MFISKNHKLILSAAILALTIFPRFAFGKTLLFKEKNWEIPEGRTVTNQPTVRASEPLLAVIQAQILGTVHNPTNYLFSEETIKTIDLIALETNQKPKSAKLVLENNRAKEFEPGQDGQALDTYQLYRLLAGNEKKVGLPVMIAQPPIKLADTNTLGINHLVATGESNFTGSSKNRTTNIRVGSSKYNGVILKPGEEFSFNENLGDVDAEHGFLPELVIKRTGVVPEFGGGLCQVSTTTFRAAMNAGLPITARRNHSFAVKYYAPQGTDATIYPGASDLKFINDLPSHLLIWTRVEGTKLYFDFYGTKDDRLVEFDGPYQYDKRTDGSMKATWTRKVTLNGQAKEQVFKSTYLPPALFQPVQQPTTPNPQSPQPSPTTQ